jgi:anhydro-N-acetylmuramic acid kinase
MESYNAIGLMSGTSLDGLDIAACEFFIDNGAWSFNIKYCHTFPYPDEWTEKLTGLPSTDALTFSLTNVEYGHLLGKLTRSFIQDTGFHPDLIASHGHTVFHQPGRGLTVQVGAGSAIAAETGIPVVCDFRSADVALGGQGAPLVPIGDRLLFPGFGACLNLGGFANISMEYDGQRIAYDICPVNIILNRLAARLGLTYDDKGEIARSGNPDAVLLGKLNDLSYYAQKYPKSLGREWLETDFIPLVSGNAGPEKNLLHTLCNHIAYQVNRSLPGPDPFRVLVTGGGAHNHFLMELIRSQGNHDWIVPVKELTDFKEALVFAFLGLLRWRNEINILRSVTGSQSDHSAGAIYKPV